MVCPKLYGCFFEKKYFLVILWSSVYFWHTEYTKMLAESREQALDRMKKSAENMGADAIVCMRYTTSTVMQGMAEFLSYGTAVKIKRRF